MNYKSSREIADQWHMSPRTIRNFCSQNKIPGAVYSGKQWLIPIDARPPVDGRTKEARTAPANYHYKFPVFIYSPYYSNPTELSEEEQLLLTAQKLHLEGRYYDSIIICRRLLSDKLPAQLTAGIYCTIGFDALLMGMHSECNSAINMLKRLIEAEVPNREDIRLMAASLCYHIKWNYEQLISIDPGRLSPEAIPFYQYNILFIDILSGSEKSRSAFRYYQANCVSLAQLGITPALFVLHCMLGVENISEKSAQEKEYHVSQAVRIAVDNNWLAHLAKFCNYESALIEKCLGEHGNKYIKMLNEKRASNVRNWCIINNIETGAKYNRFSGEQVELLLLVSYGFSYKKIAAIKGCSASKIKSDIQQLSTIAGVKTTAALRVYAKKAFASNTFES